ncbi:kinase-like domain-containing protein [Leptodontidium sp. MPI-SDFR-AT-0119]|nr:kinase-like domain-containing protein [Leptodontidium sp. MPI-SDFR-AT-0119]
MNAFRVTRRLHNIHMSNPIVAGTKLIEEEILLHYSASSFFPVRVSQVFHERYKVEAKFGFGGSSTVWLCRDKKDDTYKTLKVGTFSTVENRESKITVPGGAHQCLVYEPLGMSLLEYVNLQPNKKLTMRAAAWVTTYLLTGLDYLHTCGVVHTDIKLDNILTTLPDDEEAILTKLINTAHEDPVKVIDDSRSIYTSRTPEYGNHLTYPIICDFGMAVFGQDEYDGLIQPIPYRAPEVILGMKWKSSADIWNLGVIIWELLFSEHIFGSSTERGCLEMMITYLGPPPTEFLQRNALPSSYFDKHGGWRGADITPIALHNRLEGVDVELFLDFLKSMLRWVPKERGTAAALLRHPWLDPK